MLPPSIQGPAIQTISILNEAIKIIVQVEVIGQAIGLQGPDKLKAAVPGITQLILQADSFKGRKIDNPELFKEGCTEITEGLVTVLNSLEAIPDGQ